MGSLAHDGYEISGKCPRGRDARRCAAADARLQPRCPAATAGHEDSDPIPHEHTERCLPRHGRSRARALAPLHVLGARRREVVSPAAPVSAVPRRTGYITLGVSSCLPFSPRWPILRQLSRPHVARAMRSESPPNYSAWTHYSPLLDAHGNLKPLVRAAPSPSPSPSPSPAPARDPRDPLDPLDPLEAAALSFDGVREAARAAISAEGGVPTEDAVLRRALAAWGAVVSGAAPAPTPSPQRREEEADGEQRGIPPGARPLPCPPPGFVAPHARPAPAPPATPAPPAPLSFGGCGGCACGLGPAPYAPYAPPFPPFPHGQAGAPRGGGGLPAAPAAPQFAVPGAPQRMSAAPPGQWPHAAPAAFPGGRGDLGVPGHRGAHAGLPPPPAAPAHHAAPAHAHHAAPPPAPPPPPAPAAHGHGTWLSPPLAELWAALPPAARPSRTLLGVMAEQGRVAPHPHGAGAAYDGRGGQAALGGPAGGVSWRSAPRAAAAPAAAASAAPVADWTPVDLPMWRP